MLRSRTTRQAAPSNGSLSSKSMPHYNSGENSVSDDPRGRSKSIIPKSLIGTLVVASILFLMLLFSGSLSNDISRSTNSSSRNSDGNGKLVAKVDDSSITHETNQQLRNAASVQSNNNKSINNAISTTSPTTGATLHLIFSTDCGSFQHWQSYLFFHRAYTVQQPGYITRIASGCTPEQRQFEQQWHDEHVKGIMSERYRIHFTPHFSGVLDEDTGEVKGDYKFFNKPFGLKHFLEESDLLGLNTNNNNNNGNSGSDKEMKHPNDIIILCDPDFALLRPITDDFSNQRDTLVGPRRSKYFQSMSSHIVTHGQPYAQTYGLGTQWRKFNLDEIAGLNSPAKNVDQKNGGLFYPAGPPYIGTASDMYKIAVAWSEFAPRVYKEYPHLLAEMYAYCIAAAHLQLPHTLIDSLMISSPDAAGEGWKFIHAIPISDTCSFATQPDHSIRPLPSLIHYCQRYIVDTRYFFGKRKVPHEIFTCDHPLLEEPPMTLGQGEMNTEKDRMAAFVICAMTRFTNDAMVFFKERHCEGGGNRGRTELVPHAKFIRKKVD